MRAACLNAPLRPALGCGLLLSVPLVGLTQAGPRTELAMRFRAGEVNRYRTTAQTVVTLPVPNQPQPGETVLSVDLAQQMRTVRALPGGGGEVEALTTGGDIYMNGKPYAQPDGKPFTINYNAQGDIAAIKGLTPQASFGGLLGSGTLGMQSAFLPSHAVREGEVWQHPMRLPGMPVSGAGSVTCRWLSTERVGRFTTARIRTFLSQPLKILLTADSQPTQDPRNAAFVMTGQLSMTFISNFAIAEGKVVRSSGVGGATLTPRTKSAAANAKPAPPVPENGRITLKMRIGYNLME